MFCLPVPFLRESKSFRTKGVAQGLVLKQGHKVIPKWPIVLVTTTA